MPPENRTPTTEEVRDAFATRKWDNFQRNYPNSDDKAERDAERERFGRWHDQVKAEALREYAAALEAVPDYAPSEYDQGRVDERHMTITELLERAVHVRAKTVTAEQVEAAAGVVAEVTGEPQAGRFERTMARAAFRAAGFLIEGADEIERTT